MTLAPNKTYRLRLINTGSFVAMRFAVDGHVLTVIEADGTAVTPFDVSAVSVAVAQRYSVLLRTNETAGAYWMRAALDQDAFTVSNVVDGYLGRPLICLDSTITRACRPRCAVSCGMAWTTVHFRMSRSSITRQACPTARLGTLTRAPSSPSAAGRPRMLPCTSIQLLLQ